jgi:hypothetical protein
MTILMVSLPVAVHFGTAAYMLARGHFPAGDAEATLALIMFLKIVFCVLLLLAERRFRQNKGLVILFAATLGATWVVAFLIAFLRSFSLASSTSSSRRAAFNGCGRDKYGAAGAGA